MDVKDLRFAVFGICSLYGTTSQAIEPASVSDGPVAVIPQLSVQLAHDDNIFSRESNETSSEKVIVTPSVELRAERANDAYRVRYALENGTFTDSHDDDYTDHELMGQAIIELNSRNRFDLQAGYLKEHEDRGTEIDNQNLTGIVVDKPIEFSEFNLQGLYTYGAKGAKGNLELNAAYYDREYDNFRTLTEVRDRETIRLGATFLYRLAPKSQALFELRHEDIDYQSATSTQDSTEQKYLLGLRWDATAKTSGSAKIGAARKDFDDPTSEDFSGGSWEIGVRWAPQSYSSFDLTTAQEAEEASGIGNYIDTESLTLAWKHEWSSRLSSVATLIRIEEDYVGATREDETNSLSLAVTYEMRRWLDINFAYTYGERDSNEVGSGYERNQWMITLLGSL